MPKGREANLRWRQALRQKAADDEGVQEQLRDACSRSIILWINAFVWTFRQKVTLPDGSEAPMVGHEANQPFITWLVQDEIIAEVQDCIKTGKDADVIKSRDMGASWLLLAVFHHGWLFGENQTYKELSRKEDLVDKRGDMDSLFEKHRYINKWLPEWMRPTSVTDNVMLLRNNDRDNAIMGESTNVHAGQGGRNTAIMVDEFGRMDNGEEIELSTADTTSCRLFNSTPSGPGTAFHKRYKDHPGRFLKMPWWRHPEKGFAAHQVRDENGKPRWTSPWYEQQKARRTKKDLAQNVDMNFGEAGDTFFDIAELEQYHTLYVRQPEMACSFKWGGDYGPEKLAEVVRHRDMKSIVRSTASQSKPWRFWMPLGADGRPPQEYTYVIACDISNGAGHSNSVASVRAVEIDTIVAKMWDSFMSPEDFAEQVAMAGVWFGGASRQKVAFLIWENNGPGGIFGRKLVKKLKYPHYYINMVDDVIREKQTSRWGWHSNAKKKEILLANYREDLKIGRTIVHCDESIKEAMDYIYDESGVLIPGKLRQETAGGRALHGDHVIADALSVLGRDELPKGSTASRDNAPAGTFAQRQQVAKRNRDREKDAWAK